MTRPRTRLGGEWLAVASTAAVAVPAEIYARREPVVTVDSAGAFWVETFFSTVVMDDQSLVAMVEFVIAKVTPHWSLLAGVVNYVDVIMAKP